VISFRKATELNPKFVEAYYNWGELLEQMGKRDEAIAEWQKAVEVTPGYAKAQYRLGDAYYQMGMIREALAHWQKGINVEANHLAVLNQVAWLLATNPDKSIRNGGEAMAYAERALGLAGGDKPEILDTLAAAYAEAGRFSSAARTARRALDLATQQNKQELIEELKARVTLYDGGKAFRDETESTSPGMRMKN
jgi:protein O-mannosyl-transferase